MAYKDLYIFWIFGLLILFTSCGDNKEKEAYRLISQIKNIYAPDKRVALFDIQYEANELRGETNLTEALTHLKDSLVAYHIKFDDKVTLLPEASLGGKVFAIVHLSVANIRSQPKHSAELATQATMGTPLKVLKQTDSWYLVQTPDQYISWVDAGGITLLDKEGIENWYASQKAVFTPPYGFVFEEPNENHRLSDLTAGNILQVTEKGSNFHEVKLPDGRKGYVSSSSLIPYDAWIESRSTSPANLINTAKGMMGVPYLWGGTSIKGVDCSGFTKTIFFLNGKIIPRDASQQVHEGEEVDIDKDWTNLEIGDLLFFGVPATKESPERVVHVGMWIGNNSFIHSRGMVRISSFDPDSPNYDEYELNRYLRTKRIVGKNSKNVLAVNEIIH
jgi:cell wall-associated NlpC family hydrolase